VDERGRDGIARRDIVAVPVIDTLVPATATFPCESLASCAVASAAIASKFAAAPRA